MSIYLNSKSVNFLNMNKLPRWINRFFLFFSLEKDKETLQGQGQTPHSLQYIQEGTKHTPEHNRVFMSFIQGILIQLTLSDCMREEMFDISGLLFDLKGWTRSLLLWLEKSDRKRQMTVCVYHQVMIFIIFLYWFLSAKCLIVYFFLENIIMWVKYVRGNEANFICCCFMMHILHNNTRKDR